MAPRYTCRPIGFVENGLTRTKHVSSRFETSSTIRILDEYAPGLKGLDEYSHLTLVWWMHAASRAALQVKLEGMTGQTVGIFASHFPARPTSIGISVVELTGIDGCSVKVKGFDAWNGTPVLDIKPYDYYDIVKLPKVPKWFKEFWRERKRKGRYAEKVPWLGP